MIWKARAIWLPGGTEDGPVFVYLRRRFRLGEQPRVAPAFAASNVPYRLFLNGVPLGRGPAAAPAGIRYFDSIDLAPLLRRGINILACLCHASATLIPDGPPAFQLQAAVERGGATPIEILTDETWMALREPDTGGSPGVCSQSIGGLKQGWLRPDYNDALWSPADPFRVQPSPPVPRPLPPLTEARLSPIAEGSVLPSIEAVAAAARPPAGRHSVPSARRDGARCSVLGARGDRTIRAEHRAPSTEHRPTAGTELSPGCRRVYDFGRHVVGHPRLGVAQAQSGTLEVCSGDALAGDGSVLPAEPSGVDRWVLASAEASLDLEAFPLRGGRYLQVSFRDAATPLQLERVEIVEALYPWNRRGQFTCSDEALTRTWALCRDTLAFATRDSLLAYGPEPGPRWIAEARLQALVAGAAFGDTRLARKCLLETAGLGAEPVVLDEEAAWVFFLWEHFLQTGEHALLQELYPAVRARMARLHDWTDEYGVLNVDARPGSRAAVYIDEISIDRRGEITAANAFYHRALLTAARIAACLGDLPAQRECEHRAMTLRGAVSWRLWSEPQQAYADCRSRYGLGQRTGAESSWLAIAFGLAEPRRAWSLLQRLHAAAALETEPSPFFQTYVLEALHTLGAEAAARERISQLWGAMLAAGATTCWQHWPSAPPHHLATSPPSPSGHPAWRPAASPAYWLTAETLGVRPLQPGWRRTLVRPVLGSLEWVRGVVPAATGDLAVDCRRRSERAVELAVSVPEGMRAELTLADVREQDIVEWEGRVIWPIERAHRAVELETLPRWDRAGWSWTVSGPRDVRLRVRE